MQGAPEDALPFYNVNMLTKLKSMKSRRIQKAYSEKKGRKKSSSWWDPYKCLINCDVKKRDAAEKQDDHAELQDRFVGGMEKELAENNHERQGNLKSC